MLGAGSGKIKEVIIQEASTPNTCFIPRKTKL